MIDERELQEAIAYCNGKLEPNRNDAILLAACYALQDRLYPKPDAMSYSYAAPVERAENYADETSGFPAVGDYGNSDFLQAVRGNDPAAMWAVMDELMETLSVVNSRVYDSVMRQIKKEGR